MAEAGKVQQSRRRIGLINRQAIEASLDIAALTLLPEEYSQRDVFRVLMPKLFVMRKRGFGFRQITKLLNEAGLALAIGSVRTYYHEFLMEMLEQCESYYRSSEKTLKTVGQERSQAWPSPTDRELALSQAQAMARSQFDDRVQAKTRATIGRIIGAGEHAPQSGTAGALMAPAPAASPSSRPPESPAQRGKKPYPVPGTTASPRAASRPRTSTPPNPLVAARAGKAAVTCITAASDPEKVVEEPGLPDDVYQQDVLLEHPAIQGLLLTYAQRFYTMRLQYQLANGETTMEKGTEMIARRSWQAPQAVRKGRTSSDFVEMQSNILGKAPE